MKTLHKNRQHDYMMIFPRVRARNIKNNAANSPTDKKQKSKSIQFSELSSYHHNNKKRVTVTNSYNHDDYFMMILPNKMIMAGNQ